MTEPGRATSWTAVSRTEQIPAQAAPRHRRAVAEVDATGDDPAPPSGLDPTSEPVIIAHAVTVILSALVAAGWLTIPSPTINAIDTILAVVLSTVGAIMARARVSPLSGGLWASVKQYVEERIAAEIARLQQH